MRGIKMNLWLRRMHWWLSIAIGVATLSLLGAQRPVCADDAQEGKELLQLMFEAREALVTGECIIRAQEVSSKLNEPRSYALRLVFDFNLPAFRATPLVDPVGNEVFFLVDSYYQARQNRPVEGIGAIEKLSPRRSVRDGNWVMDIRLVGIAVEPTRFIRNWTNDYEGFKRRFLNAIDWRVEEEDGLKKFSFNDNRHAETKSASNSEWTFWIDPSRGYVNVRTQAASLPLPPDKYTEPRLRYIADLKWDRFEGYWVPTKLREETGPNYALWKFECSFEWKRVNQPIEPQLFEVEDLVPEGQRSWLIAEDPTTGQSAIVQSLGAPPKPPTLFDQLARGERTKDAPPPDPESRSDRITALIVGVGFVMLTLGAIMIARRFRGKE